jgi:hypothetical protein
MIPFTAPTFSVGISRTYQPHRFAAWLFETHNAVFT